MIGRTALTLALTVTLLASASASQARSSDVLIQPPEKTLHVGDLMNFGVWYQTFSGGSRVYEIDVYSPTGRVVSYHRGMATSKWKIFHFAPQDTGVYRTIFRLPSGRYTSQTRVLIGD